MAEVFGMRLARVRRAYHMPGEGRKVSHMTQHELAEMACIDVDTVRKYERSRRLPHPLIRRELLRIFPNLFD